MIRILLLVILFSAAACDASTIIYKVECQNPVKLTTVVWSEKDVERASTFNSGTRVILKDGTMIEYSIAIPCTITQREVK